jgi:hypothetical protein
MSCLRFEDQFDSLAMISPSPPTRHFGPSQVAIVTLKDYQRFPYVCAIPKAGLPPCIPGASIDILSQHTSRRGNIKRLARAKYWANVMVVGIGTNVGSAVGGGPAGRGSVGETNLGSTGVAPRKLVIENGQILFDRSVRGPGQRVRTRQAALAAMLPQRTSINTSFFLGSVTIRR